jgi:hypothetical protein
MRIKTLFIVVSALAVLGLSQLPVVSGEQVWIKCHITCRCLENDSLANLQFDIPIDRSPDIGHDADLTCKSYGYQVCADCCNGLKFSYTYKVTSP